MKNTLQDLNGHLFEQLERLNDDDLSDDQLDRELKRAEGMTRIAVNSDGYKLLKISMTGSLWERWIFLHRAVWINYNGDIPDGMIVSFKDSNTLNCDSENLMLISKAENSVLNRCGLRFDDPDLTETGLAVAKLKIASKKRRSKHD